VKNRSRLRNCVLAIVLTATVLGIGAVGNAHAASATSSDAASGTAAAPQQPAVCYFSVGIPFVTSSGLRPVVSVRGGISCSFVGDLRMDLTLVGPRGETTREFAANDSSLSGTTSRRCVEGVYFGKAVMSASGPNYSHEGTYYSDTSIYLTCE